MFNILLQTDVSENPLWKEQISTRMALKDINQKVWLETNLFSPVWWFMLVLFIIAWFIWWKLVDKKRLMEIVTYGLLVSILSTIFDITATQSVFWGYPNRLVPISPPLLFEDLCFLPVIFMLIYQYFTSWRSFSIALLITAFLLAFAVEPIAVWLDIFQLHSWKYGYSFLVYILMASSLKWIINNIKAKQNNCKIQ